MRKKDPVNGLKAALTARLHIDLRQRPVECRLEGDAIVLEGAVQGIALKKKALLIAMGIAGTAGVIDRLKVEPSARMTDKEIEKHFYDALSGEPALNSLGIKAEVRGGVIDIEGVVPSLTHKRLAGVLAWWVPGSTDVINSIEVDPPEEDSDDEVEDAVAAVFEKDRLVDESSLKARARDWVVTLEGVALSDEEKQAAEDDSWYVWGVNDVVNNIRVEKRRPRTGG